MTTENVKTQLEKQADYVKQDRVKRMREFVDSRQGGNGGLFDTELTVKSMRSAGYKTEAHAGADIVDNSIESGASQVHIIMNQEKGKVSEIAFIDDGSGILSDFLPWAVSWGASSQHGDSGKRNTFGRFGFGLPTASIKFATKYQVISRTDGDFHMVTIDVEDLPKDDAGRPTQPTVQPGKIPMWIVEYLSKNNTPFQGGLDTVRTVVIWQNLDGLYTRTLPETENLMQRHFGVTYAGWLNQVSIFVNGKRVEPIDVLFTSPAALYYDVEGTRAEDHGSQRIMVKGGDGEEYPITVRISRLPADAMTVRLHTGQKGQPPRIREKIRRDYNGIFMTRHGRYIQLWQPSGVPGVQWNIYMRQVCVQIDFTPELDELFGITPDKQTIAPRPQIIDILENKGVFRTIRTLANEVKDERARLKADREGKVSDGQRVSEVVMDRISEMDVLNKRPKSHEETKKREEEAKKNLERAIKEKAAKSGVPEEVIRPTVIEETSRRRFVVELASLGVNGMFYNSYPQGQQTVLQINVDHAFFKEVYSKIKPEQFELLSGLELLLFTLALSEADSTGEKAAFYLSERIRWGQYLSTMIHVQSDVIENSDLGSFTGENADEAQEVD
jgi:hypothetical protein